MQPLAAAVTDDIHNRTEQPIQSHAYIHAHETQSGEQRIDQIAGCYTEGKHGSDGKGDRIANIARGTKCAHGNKGERIQSENGEQRTDTGVISGNLQSFRAEVKQVHQGIAQEEYSAE